jgi:hypothetical protein
VLINIYSCKDKCLLREQSFQEIFINAAPWALLKMSMFINNNDVNINGDKSKNDFNKLIVM